MIISNSLTYYNEAGVCQDADYSVTVVHRSLGGGVPGKLHT